MKMRTLRSFENSARTISRNSENTDVESVAWEIMQRSPDLSARHCIQLARKAIRRKKEPAYRTV